MTRDEILKLEAGRELDALIAEKVMGWKNIKIEQYTDWTTKFLNVTGVDPGFKAPLPIHVRFYSTDIAAAWEVDEVTEIVMLNKVHGIWEAYCLTPNKESSARGESKSVTVAICRAALLASNT